MKTRTAKLRDIEQVGFPIVKAAFKGKDGNVYVGAMMVDSGSVHCILNKSVLSLIDESSVIDGKTMDIHSVQGKGVKCQGVSFNFKIGCGEYDTFYVVIVKTCSDSLFSIGQKNCQLFVAKLRNFLDSHNRMVLY